MKFFYYNKEFQNSSKKCSISANFKYRFSLKKENLWETKTFSFYFFLFAFRYNKWQKKQRENRERDFEEKIENKIKIFIDALL